MLPEAGPEWKTAFLDLQTATFISGTTNHSGLLHPSVADLQ